MRHFVLYSNYGKTNGKFNDLVKAGRLDIVANSIIHAFFISNGLRAKIDFHVILNGPPDPPKHIQIISDLQTPWSKKDIGTLLRIALWKYKKGKKVQALPGVYIEKKSFIDTVSELAEKHPVYLLDMKGKNLDNCKIKKDSVFVLGDHLGIPRKEKKAIKEYVTETISLGKIPYFSSQCITIINHHLDKLGVDTEYWETVHKFNRKK